MLLHIHGYLQMNSGSYFDACLVGEIRKSQKIERYHWLFFQLPE